MAFGLTPFTFVRGMFSLVAIPSGLVVLCGPATSNRMPGWTAAFLSTTTASIIGYFFPSHGVTPAIVLGLPSLAVFAAA